MDNLYKARLEKAELTSGMSSTPIYRRCLELLQEYQFSGDLLEFGAGSGALLKLLASNACFTRMVGIDILPRPEDLPQKIEWVRHDLNDPAPLSDQSFDLIISTELIEHLENPRMVVREWFRLLKPGGSLLMTTPNQESIRAYCGLIVGGHFTAFLGESYPAHITALLRLDIRRIFIEAGFPSPQFYYTDSGGIPKIPRILWQQISFGLLRGRIWSDNLLVIARKVFN